MSPNLRLSRTGANRPNISVGNSSFQFALFALQTILLISPALAVDQPAAGAVIGLRPLGTLLYTPDERKAMQQKPQDKPAARDATLPTQSNWRVDGYLRPTRGSPVIWVNGKADHNDAELRNGDDQVIVRINESITRRLAPGQSTAEIEFGEGNSVHIHRGPVQTDAADRHRSMNRVLRTHPK